MNRQKEIRALIVEDDTLVSEMIQGLLEEIGHTVVGKVVNGRDAVEMTKSLRPDVVLMDIEMPDVNGIEATQHILEQCPTPVVMVTAHETAELVEQATEAGAGAYLVKPPSGREMERAITIAMARFDDTLKLSRLNAELRARNEELDAFAHTVAHDLQSSLSLMIGYAEVLEQDFASLSPEAVQTYLHTIVQHGRKLSDIVDALLLLAGVHQAVVEMTPLKMTEIVAEALQRVAPLVEEHEPQIVLPDSWPMALGYGPWVEEVWTNYLSNAIKYGGHPPYVTMGATAQADGIIRFWIQDNGSGLTPEQQERLFTPFMRLDQSRVQGHGLGLSIVRRIVEKLGGEVGVKSGGVPGQGSVFSFTLPTAGSQEDVQ
jgi:two-component system sensor histidine kinase/response regulator